MLLGSVEVGHWPSALLGNVRVSKQNSGYGSSCASYGFVNAVRIESYFIDEVRN